MVALPLCILYSVGASSFGREGGINPQFVVGEEEEDLGGSGFVPTQTVRFSVPRLTKKSF